MLSVSAPLELLHRFDISGSESGSEGSLIKFFLPAFPHVCSTD